MNRETELAKVRESCKFQVEIYILAENIKLRKFLQPVEDIFSCKKLKIHKIE